MPHPEEGTVHAWLDGALSPAAATAFEARLVSDPALQAAVAEARGLIAASVRILGALDAVPGNVVPKWSSAGDVASDVSRLDVLRARAAAQSAAAHAPRRWRAQRWAAAATIVVAVGAGVLWKSGGEPVTPADLAATQATRNEPAPAPVTEKPKEVAASNAVTPAPAPAAAPATAPATAPAPSVAGDLEVRRREAGFAAKKESSVAAQDLVASKAAADATAPSRQAEGVGAVAPLGETKGRAEGAGAPAAAAAPAMAKLRATMDAASQRGSRQAPATAVLEEHIPDPRASAIGCRTVRFGEWLPALTGVRAPMLVALDSQRVAVGWRRARLLDPADARARAPGTWLVEGDSARMGLPDVGEGQALRAAINIRSGAGTAAVLGAKGDVHSRATASWIVEACGSR